jgi:HlyD family secretion protein
MSSRVCCLSVAAALNGTEHSKQADRCGECNAPRGRALTYSPGDMDSMANRGQAPDGMDRVLVQRWWQQRRWRLPLVTGLVLLLAILTGVVLLGPAQRTLRISRAGMSIATVEQGVYRDFIPLRAEAVPRDTVYLNALEGGIVRRILVQAGDIVTADQPLVEFGNAALEQGVQDRESGLVQSISALQKQEAQLELDRANEELQLADAEDELARRRRELSRRDQLVAGNVVSVEERDLYKDLLASAQRKRDLQRGTNARLETLRVQQQPQIRQQIAVLQESMKSNHEKLRSLIARAPVAGLIAAMDLNVGENLNPGSRVAEITPNTGFKLSAHVDEYYLGRVHEGQVASVDQEGKQWPATVARVYPQVKEGSFSMDLTFRGATPAGLRRGQSLQGRLSLGEDQPCLVLASGAFLDGSGGNWVFVLATDGRSAQRRRVKLGRRNAEQVEVLAGLSAGEQVVVSDYTGLDRIDRISF